VAVREFDAVDDGIRCAVGAAGVTGPSSMLLLAKVLGDGSWQGGMGLWTSGNTPTITLQRSDSLTTPANSIRYVLTQSSDVGAITWNVAAGWVLIGFSKASGSAIPTMHLYSFSSGLWTHTAAAAAIANGTSVAGGTIRFGIQGTDTGNMRIAAAAVYDVALTNANVDAITAAGLKTSSLYRAAGTTPKGLWEFNQASTATNVVDLTGGGADQNAITGTTVITGDDPAGWTFDGIAGLTPTIDLGSPAYLSGPDAPPGFFEALLLPTPPAADVVTPVADSDSGTGSETSDVQATVPGAETSTGTDTGTVSATASDSDSGTESDAGTVAASVPGSDSASGTDTGVSSTTGTGSDSGTGSEAGTASVTLSGSDSGTGTDAQVSIVSPVAGSDSAAGSETDSTSVTAPGSDSSTGSEASTASVTAASSDSGTGTEAQVVTETGAGGEGGAGTEAGTVNVTAPGSDSSTGTEAGTASVTASGSDSGTATDAGSVADITGGATPISGSDSGVGTETGVVVDLTPPAPPDTGGGRDVDFGDETSIYGEPPRHLTDSDFAVSLEHGEVVDLTPPPAPRRIRIRLPRRRAPEPVDVFRALSDGDGAVGTEEQAHFAAVAAVDAGRGVEDAGDMQDFSEGAAEEMQVLALLGVL
jgi:hypothetical protein